MDYPASPLAIYRDIALPEVDLMQTFLSNPESMILKYAYDVNGFHRARQVQELD